MAAENENTKIGAGWPELVRRVRERTPARLLTGRSGAAYRTGTLMELREAHAAARDAVRAELDLHSSFDAEFRTRWKVFEVSTQARSKEEYLLRPDLGRRFDDRSRSEILQKCPKGSDLQIAIGDGLSAPAVISQVPAVLPLLVQSAESHCWSIGQMFLARHCRVGILNEIGELLSPAVVVLLIGERPGLATAQSLSAYMAYRPNSSHTDAERNLISNIHARGLSPSEAVVRIVALAEALMRGQISGCNLKVDGGATLQIE
jgi:ethanolamine ammonia-lyase small subunit